MNSRHNNLTFSKETETDGYLSFLDVKIFREDGSFVTTVYRKPTFSGIYTNFTSFMPKTYKYGLILTLLFRSFTLASDFSKFHTVMKLTNHYIYISKNGYPKEFIDSCVKRFLNKLFISRPPVFTVNKKEILLVYITLFG